MIMKPYNPHELEPRWQHVWDTEGLAAIGEDASRPKMYVLEMFPYPSGDIHMGHVRNYSIGDVVARYYRMRGYDVLHPMGWDAFGLPAENAALKHNSHPANWTYTNIETQKASFQRMGFCYDWDRSVVACDASYYKWGQWLFLQMWKAGLVERRNSPVNWCGSCETVLANEQVIEGACWRCHGMVEKRDLTQWYLKITRYAQELLDNLDQLQGWPDRVVQMQANWIGRSEGAEIDFVLVPRDDEQAALDAPAPTASNPAFAAAATSASCAPTASTSTTEPASTSCEPHTITVFTTRPDTLFGCSFFLLAPEYKGLIDMVRGSHYEAGVRQVIEQAATISAVERAQGDRPKHGAFTGRYVINPINQDKIPVWVADYVLSDYGTGAVMAVPCGDERDFSFAKAYNLPIIPIIVDESDQLYSELKGLQERRVSTVAWEAPHTTEGVLVQSGPYTGMQAGKGSPAAKAIIDTLSAQGQGRPKVEFRLRDWLISRQRYWGNPIPAIHCQRCGVVPVPEKDLPVRLPQDIDLAAGETLATHASFVNTTCPVCGGCARRETDTMDTFTCSSWYYLRYIDPHNDQAPFSSQKAKRWMPVDHYVGGIEHAILHLLYSRFYTLVLRDMGMLVIDEPFSNLLCQGMVKDEQGETMSKSKGNVIAPEEMIAAYGADAVRAYILFMAPPDKDLLWDEAGLAGMHKFLNRAWRVVFDLKGQAGSDTLYAPYQQAHVQTVGTPPSVGAPAPALDNGPASAPAIPNAPGGGTPAPTSAGEQTREKLLRERHRVVGKVMADFDRNNFNTALAAIMELTNAASDYLHANSPQQRASASHQSFDQEVASVLVKLLAPFVPHWAEELWRGILGYTQSVHLPPWVDYDPSLAAADTVELAVQINGKVKNHINVAHDVSNDMLEQLALHSVKNHLEHKAVQKVVVVAGRLVNIVAK